MLFVNKNKKKLLFQKTHKMVYNFIVSSDWFFTQRTSRYVTQDTSHPIEFKSQRIRFRIPPCAESLYLIPSNSNATLRRKQIAITAQAYGTVVL